ncbi:MAG TPA: nitroreductase family deazaflavin-dependent oxidoreductase [Solirubrobacterales bacterium]|jgi:deazaflavin-dependent oxidoreductase (nitroreductase family)|nr:nitroreductase family deazaflavin-dependent oxidoreductase [Solirubrobacterales bacterium]
MDRETAEERASRVGIGSLAIGAVLIAAPRRIGRLADLGVREMRLIALADLAVAPGLIRGPRRPWMLARAGVNVAIGGLLLRRGTRTGRLLATALGAVTVADLGIAAALADDGGAETAAAGAPSLCARFNLAASEAMNDRGIYLGRRSTRLHVAAYRRSGGKLGGSLPGWPEAKVALVDHRGARTGAPRTSPVMYHRDGEAIAVVASKAGQPTNPAWFHNLMANPETTLQIGEEVRPVRARLATQAEGERLWPEFDAFYPGYAAFRERARPRVIPIVLLEPRPGP